MNKVFNIKQISHDKQTFIYNAQIDASHPVFSGHFPQKPVVPGVCTMSMIKQCIADALSYDVRYDYIMECKFIAAITPSVHDIVQVSIILNTDDSQMSVVAIVTSQEVTMMKLKATFLKIA